MWPNMLVVGTSGGVWWNGQLNPDPRTLKTILVPTVSFIMEYNNNGPQWITSTNNIVYS